MPSPPELLPGAAQLELPVGRQRVPDRNAQHGGRSFYFFDFDDNVMFLTTRIFLFRRDNGAELALSTREFARISKAVGRAGPWADFVLDQDDRTGSFRRFRDFEPREQAGRPQPFIEDLEATLARGDPWWRGPSWPLFDHAVFNQRPIAIITARGHHPDTIRAGIDLLWRAGHLSAQPNYLGIYPVSNREVRAALGDPTASRPVPELKRAAIEAAVDEAMRRYGVNPHHRFGMSDDDPHNVELCLAAMAGLKRRHPDNAFFVIDTSQRPVLKTEVLLDERRATALDGLEQLALFG